jgi:hypothetical protein
MTTPAIAIADAVAAAIGEATLSQPVTAKRAYVPRFRTTVSGIQILVVPKADGRTAGSVAVDDAMIGVDIGVFKKLTSNAADEDAEIAEIDGLLELCEELKAIWNRKEIAGATGGASVQDPLYGVEELDEGRLFVTAISAPFRTMVAM